MLHKKVSIFAGDNKCGKPTFPETIVYILMPLIGGLLKDNAGFIAAFILQHYLNIEWNRQTTWGLFFRAGNF